MSEAKKVICPECGDDVPVASRREFIRVLGAGAAAAGGLGGLGGCLNAQEKDTKVPAKPEKPAESLIKELYASLTAEQKQTNVMAWDHGAVAGKQTATRLRMYNRAIGKNIAESWTPAQADLNKQILRAIVSDDAGWRCISRGGSWDASKSFENCGANLFGDPSGKFAWVFSGHHLTVRCDGNSEPGAGFGGPMYYGHTPNGYSDRNVFFFQTKSVLSVYDALSEEQRKVAVVTGNPGEQEASIRIRAAGQAKPGLKIGDLSADHKKLIEQVMRDLLSPYRKEDGDEVMELIKTRGGLDAVHLAYYKDAKMHDDRQWHFWRLEGPGMVWNFRVLPHVHTFVNITGVNA